MARTISKRRQFLRFFVVVLTVEKTLQHLILALLFFDLFPSVGVPYIGPNFLIDNSTMVFLNLVYALIFGIALFGIINKMRWGTSFAIILAALDIILEFVFHGLFYITVSVIMSTALIISGALYAKKIENKASAS